MPRFVEHVRLDVERRARAGVPEDPADLHHVEAEVDDQVARERVAQVVVVPTSAQTRICRCHRYADVCAEGLLGGFFGVERSA